MHGMVRYGLLGTAFAAVWTALCLDAAMRQSRDRKWPIAAAYLAVSANVWFMVWAQSVMVYAHSLHWWVA